jgi:toxin HigB-1
MIRTFRCDQTALLHSGFASRKFRNIEMATRTRLARLHAATSLEDLARIPGNRMEALTGGRKGQHSIRINDQWRICFRWEKGDAFEVEIVDYH